MDNKDMPAMPGQPRDQGGFFADEYKSGLTKREYIAALAMQGALSNQRVQLDKPAEGIAIFAVRHADALLEALNKSN